MLEIEKNSTNESIHHPSEAFADQDELEKRKREMKHSALFNDVVSITNVINEDVVLSMEKKGITEEDYEPIVAEYQARSNDIAKRLRAVVAAFALGMTSASGATSNTENIQQETVAVATNENENSAFTQAQTMGLPSFSVYDEGEVPTPVENVPEEVIKREGLQEVSNPVEMSDEEKQAQAEAKARTERVQAGGKVVAERLEKGFENEEELFAFFGEVARTSAVEHMALYGVNEQNKIEILKKWGGDEAAVPIGIKDFDVEQYRERGHKKLTAIHTHPQSSLETILEIIKKEGTTIAPEASFPFSPLDINTALIAEYNNRYGNMGEWMQGVPGEYTFDHVVVDPSGVWKYSVDPSHEHFQDIEHERLNATIESEYGQEFLKKYPSLSKEEFFEIIKTGLSPDELIRDRSHASARTKGVALDDLISLLNSYRVGEFTSSEGHDMEYTNMQFSVLNGEKTPQEFIEFCKERGITATYTPFKKDFKSTHVVEIAE